MMARFRRGFRPACAAPTDSSPAQALTIRAQGDEDRRPSTRRPKHDDPGHPGVASATPPFDEGSARELVAPIKVIIRGQERAAVGDRRWGMGGKERVSQEGGAATG